MKCTDRALSDRSRWALPAAPVLLTLFALALRLLGTDGQAQSPTKWRQMDFGPFFSGTFDTPLAGLKNPTFKGIAIKLRPDGKDVALFDTDLLRFSAWWSGGFIELAEGRDGLGDSVSAKPVGRVQIVTPNVPGWSGAGDFVDPRPHPWGPAPAELVKYHGLYLHEQSVVLSYSVGSVNVLDFPSVETDTNFEAFSRIVEWDSLPSAVNLLLCQRGDGSNSWKTPAGVLVIDHGPNVTAVALVHPPAGAELSVQDGRARARLLPQAGPARVKVLLWSGARAELAKFETLAQSSPEATPLTPRTLPSTPHWSAPVVTAGTLGTESGAYVVDTLTAPYENPWKSYLRFSGHDFFANGDAAICSISGDVWIVKGLDAGLSKLTWIRHATGLFEPLGLKIVNDRLYVLGRDQITLLHDLNGDGEADFYENFNNDAEVFGHGHGFHTELHTDTEGNFYYCACADPDGRPGAHGGSLLKVTRDGRKLERIASGFRNPNGMTVGTNGMITVADQQGNWVPSSRIDWVRPGGFYGYFPMHHRAEPPKTFDKPLMWIPHSADNSCGGEAWIESDRWGPWQGQLAHLSYGACRLFIVLPEIVDGEIQGATFALPLKFSAGVMRARFHPVDGQLYVCGLRGWQTAGPLSGGFYRVRYTGKPVRSPIQFHVEPSGVRLTFSETIDRTVASDPGNYHVEQWNYLWSQAYGSADYSVADPKKKGRDPVAIRAAVVSEDARSVTLLLASIQPVMQMRVQYNIQTTGGAPLKDEVFNTINATGARPSSVGAAR